MQVAEAYYAVPQAEEAEFAEIEWSGEVQWTLERRRTQLVLITSL